MKVDRSTLKQLQDLYSISYSDMPSIEISEIDACEEYCIFGKHNYGNCTKPDSLPRCENHVFFNHVDREPLPVEIHNVRFICKDKCESEPREYKDYDDLFSVEIFEY